MVPTSGSSRRSWQPVPALRSAFRWLILIGVAAWALYWGATNLWVAARERHPVETTCAAYAARRPSAHWLRLTGCVPDLDHVAIERVHEERAGIEVDRRITAVYLPLLPAGGPRGRAHVVLKSTDPDLVFLASQAHGSATADEAADRVSKWLAEPIEGLVHFGLDVSQKEQKALAQLGLELAPDYAILDEGHHPYVWFALLALVAGLAGAGASVWRLARLLRAPASARAASRLGTLER
jgi:hypothetical protein